MAKKATSSQNTALVFGIKSGDITETFEFQSPCFLFNGEIYKSSDLFEGEDLKAEHAEMAAELFKIGSGIIKKVITP